MTGRAWVGSIAVHGVLIAIALVRVEQAPDLHAAAPTLELIDVSVEGRSTVLQVPIANSAKSGGSDRGRSTVLQVTPRGQPSRSPDNTSPWGQLTIGEDTGNGNGTGNGTGNGFGTGNGTGIGFGDGGGVEKIHELPAVPAPFVSKARPAKLIHPTRETEVDEAELFEARITVDQGGDVVGAHMLRSHPGSRGDTASSMIWQFRYLPALDDEGAPVRSTFVQTFAVR